jgi:hypothetical protein
MHNSSRLILTKYSINFYSTAILSLSLFDIIECLMVFVVIFFLILLPTRKWFQNCFLFFFYQQVDYLNERHEG